MKTALKLFSLFLLVLLLIVPMMAQDVTAEANPVATEPPLPASPASEGGAETAVIAPVVAADDEQAEPLFSYDVLVMAGAALLAVGFCGVFLLILKSLEALKVSVPQESLTLFGNQLIELMIRTRQDLAREATRTITPLDDALVMMAGVPIDAIIKEIERRTANVSLSIESEAAQALSKSPAFMQMIKKVLDNPSIVEDTN